MQTILEKLQQRHKNDSLNLSYNALGCITGDKLAKMLASLHNNTPIVTLDLSGNNLGSKTEDELAKIFAALRDTAITITTLDLSENDFEKSSITVLVGMFLGLASTNIRDIRLIQEYDADLWDDRWEDIALYLQEKKKIIPPKLLPSHLVGEYLEHGLNIRKSDLFSHYPPLPEDILETLFDTMQKDALEGFLSQIGFPGSFLEKIYKKVFPIEFDKKSFKSVHFDSALHFLYRWEDFFINQEKDMRFEAKEHATQLTNCYEALSNSLPVNLEYLSKSYLLLGRALHLAQIYIKDKKTAQYFKRRRSNLYGSMLSLNEGGRSKKTYSVYGLDETHIYTLFPQADARQYPLDDASIKGTRAKMYCGNKRYNKTKDDIRDLLEQHEKEFPESAKSFASLR